MSKERWIFVGLAGVASAGLMVDRLILAPSSASAALPTDQAALLAGPVSSATNTLGDAATRSLKGVLQSVVRDELASKASSLEFGPAAEWVKTPELLLAESSAGGQNLNGTLTRQVSESNVQERLTLVMPTSTGGIAVIGGKRLRVGEVHPSGFRLLGVQDRSVTIERDGVKSVLTMYKGS
ncbi:MAG: hypothetical protein AB8F26_06365 [Phycisphaerales bacterium]